MPVGDICVNNYYASYHCQGGQYQKPPNNLAQNLAATNGWQTMLLETVGIIHMLLPFLAMVTTVVVMVAVRGGFAVWRRAAGTALIVVWCAHYFLLVWFPYISFPCVAQSKVTAISSNEWRVNWSFCKFFAKVQIFHILLSFRVVIFVKTTYCNDFTVEISGFYEE